MKSLTILLADDHSDFRKVVRDFLRKLPNISVVGEATNGAEVVEKVGQLSPDVVLMDITMPVQNGLEATRIIKQYWPETKVLIATMHDSPFYRKQAEQAHADGYLLKSQLKSSLESSIRSLQSGPDPAPIAVAQ